MPAASSPPRVAFRASLALSGLQIARKRPDVLQAKHAKMDARKTQARQEVAGRKRGRTGSAAAGLFCCRNGDPSARTWRARTHGRGYFNRCRPGAAGRRSATCRAEAGAALPPAPRPGQAWTAYSSGRRTGIGRCHVSSGKRHGRRSLSPYAPPSERCGRACRRSSRIRQELLVQAPQHFSFIERLASLGPV